MENLDDELMFMDDDITEDKEYLKYDILIVDDESIVHDMTSLALRDVEFKNKGVNFLHAYSAQEATQILKENQNIAVIFLDVIMETDTAGLDLVKVIREDLKNTTVRIILRTGQPGMSPEEDIIVNYDINDYKDKTELTQQKLFSSLISALRSYGDLIKIQKNKDGLEKVLKSISSIVEFRFIDHFFDGMLNQVVSLISTHHALVNENVNTIIAFYKDSNISKLVGTGKYQDEQIRNDAIKNNYSNDIQKIFKDSQSIKEKDYLVFHKFDGDSKAILLILEGDISSISIEDDLLETFICNAANIYENLLIIDKNKD